MEIKLLISEPLHSKIFEKYLWKSSILPYAFFLISNRAAKGWGWEFGQNLSNCQATDQAENLEI